MQSEVVERADEKIFAEMAPDPRLPRPASMVRNTEMGSVRKYRCPSARPWPRMATLTIKQIASLRAAALEAKDNAKMLKHTVKYIKALVMWRVNPAESALVCLVRSCASTQ